MILPGHGELFLNDLLDEGDVEEALQGHPQHVDVLSVHGELLLNDLLDEGNVGEALQGHPEHVDLDLIDQIGYELNIEDLRGATFLGLTLTMLKLS